MINKGVFQKVLWPGVETLYKKAYGTPMKKTKVRVEREGSWFRVVVDGIPGEFHLTNTFVSYLDGNVKRFELHSDGKATKNGIQTYPNSIKEGVRRLTLFVKKHHNVK